MNRKQPAYSRDKTKEKNQTSKVSLRERKIPRSIATVQPTQLQQPIESELPKKMEEEEIVPKILLSDTEHQDGFQPPYQKSAVGSDTESQQEDSIFINFKVPNNDIDADDYFDDGIRRIDFILVWKKEELKEAKRTKFRNDFFDQLERVGIEREQFFDPVESVYYEKLHATNEFLFDRADRFKIKMPLCDAWQKQIETLQKQIQQQEEQAARDSLRHKVSASQKIHLRGKMARGKFYNMFWSIYKSIKKPFEIKNDDHKWNKDFKYSAVYCEKERDFFIEPELGEEAKRLMEDNFFSKDFESNRERIRLVYRELEKLQITSHYFNTVFTTGYPPHDGDYDEKDTKSLRAKLHEYWARYSNWYIISPVDTIQSYYGEEVGLYFAFMTLYTASLAIFSVVGIIGILYGISTLHQSTENGYIKELCSLNNVTMCPICNDGCPFFAASDNCMAAKILHMFDNGWTVPYSCLVSVWAIIFLELWKRIQYRLTFKWNCSEFDTPDDYVRPAYIEKSNGTLKYRPSKLRYEVHIPAHERRKGFGFSCVTILFFLSLVIMAVFSCMFFQLWLSALLLPRNDMTLFDNTAMEAFWSYEYVVAGIVSSVLCLVLIILDYIFGSYAHKLTEWEYPRTQNDYDNSYSFKLFCFYFVNYYSWPFYIAFIKDSLTGTPPAYTKVFGYKWLGCGVAGCNYEVTIQMMIVMIFKPIALNIYHYFLPQIMIWCKKSSNTASTTTLKNEGPRIPEEESATNNNPTTHFTSSLGLRRKRRWEKQRDLLPENPLSYDYIEMVIQFGFVALFSTAFPLAAFFAFLNNIMEIRRDANKYTRYTVRSIPKRVKSIGIWQPIFTFMACLSILTNVLQLAFISETIPKWIWTNDHNRSISGYAMSKFNEIEVKELGKHGLDVNKIPEKFEKNFEKCFYEEAGTYNTTTGEFEYSKQFYRVWVYKLSFALIFTLGIYLFFILIEWLIPDRERHLVELDTQTKYILDRKRVELRENELLEARNLGMMAGSPGLKTPKQSNMSHTRSRSLISKSGNSISNLEAVINPRLNKPVRAFSITDDLYEQSCSKLV